MPEQTLWSGTSSQWKNFGAFLSCLLVLPIPWAIYRWLLVKSTTYTLTSERLLIVSGLLNKTTDSVELYRVRDYEITQPFLLRFLGLQNVALVTADVSSPRIAMECIPVALDLPAKIRHQVEECRVRKSVRTVDLEDGHDLHGGASGALN